MVERIERGEGDVSEDIPATSPALLMLWESEIGGRRTGLVGVRARSSAGSTFGSDG